MPVLSYIHELHLLDLPVWTRIAQPTLEVGEDAIYSSGGLTAVV